MKNNSNIGEIAGAIAASGKLYLGDPAVVEAQVRHFIGGIVTRWGAYVANKMTGDEFSSANAKEVFALAKNMSGGDPRFAPVVGWTGVAEQQGAFLLRALNGKAQPSLVAEAGPCGAIAASLLVDTYNAIDVAEKSGDEQAYKDALLSIVEEGTRLFMGLPSQAELEVGQPG